MRFVRAGYKRRFSGTFGELINEENHDDNGAATEMQANKSFNEQRTMAVHGRYKSLYISLPSSAQQQQREMSKLCVARRMRTKALVFLDLISGLNVCRDWSVFFPRLSTNVQSTIQN